MSKVTKEWDIHVHVEEDTDTTHVRAELHGPAGRTLLAQGRARRNPHDRPVVQIGEEVALARALYMLADELMDRADADIQTMTQQAWIQ